MTVILMTSKDNKAKHQVGKDAAFVSFVTIQPSLSVILQDTFEISSKRSGDDASADWDFEQIRFKTVTARLKNFWKNE